MRSTGTRQRNRSPSRSRVRSYSRSRYRKPRSFSRSYRRSASRSRKRYSPRRSSRKSRRRSISSSSDRSDQIKRRKRRRDRSNSSSVSSRSPRPQSRSQSRLARAHSSSDSDTRRTRRSKSVREKEGPPPIKEKLKPKDVKKQLSRKRSSSRNQNTKDEQNQNEKQSRSRRLDTNTKPTSVSEVINVDKLKSKTEEKSNVAEKNNDTKSNRAERHEQSTSSSSSSDSDSTFSSESDTASQGRKTRKSKLKTSPQKPPTKPRKEEEVKPEKDLAAVAKLMLHDPRAGRTGGVYIPPFKLAQLKATQTEDKSSKEYQRMTWDALRKSLNGLINKVNVSNIAHIIPELFQENLVRGRGVLTRSIMKAQLASPGFTHIYAALVAVLNTKMPENGELLLKRVVYRFRRSFQRGDKVVAIALVRFIAHLVNQQVVHELLALEVLTLLLASPTDDSVEVAVNFTKESGQILAELCPEGLRAIFERFRGILQEGDIDKRVQYTIEGLFAIRKGNFADYPAVHEELDLVEASDQITHEIGLNDTIDPEDRLDVFRFDPEYEKNEELWDEIKKEILGDSDAESDGGDEAEADQDEANQEQAKEPEVIQDMTEQDLVNLRRTIYLTIMSSVSHEECAHKLLKIQIRTGQEKEICSMLIECCSQERTYLRYYGLLGQRFCLIKREYQDAFDEAFMDQYSYIHRLETNKLRNVAKFFAHLLFTDALPWTVFEYIRLNEEETTSSSRIFIKMLCQELSEHMGLKKLKERFMDQFMQQVFAGLFPKDHPRNTRFAINFFTSIGLGGLTTELREHLKNAPKIIMSTQPERASGSESSSSSDDSSSSSSSSGEDGSSSGSSSSDSSSDSDSSDTSSDSE